MAFEYIYDYNQSFYIKITNILKQLNIDVEETLSSDHMYGLQEFVTGNVVIFELNKNLFKFYILKWKKEKLKRQKDHPADI